MHKPKKVDKAWLEIHAQENGRTKKARPSQLYLLLYETGISV